MGYMGQNPDRRGLSLCFLLRCVISGGAKAQAAHQFSGSSERTGKKAKYLTEILTSVIFLERMFALLNALLLCEAVLNCLGDTIQEYAQKPVQT